MGTLLDDLSGIHHQNKAGDSLGRLEDRERMVHGLVMVAARPLAILAKERHEADDILKSGPDEHSFIHLIVQYAVALGVAPETDRSNQRKSTKQLRY